MDMMVALIAAIAVLNVVASAKVLRIGTSTASQRALQLALIWLLPVIGAVVCMAVASTWPQGGAGMPAGASGAAYSGDVPAAGSAGDQNVGACSPGTGDAGCGDGGGD